ncbi:Surfeit locus protein 2 family protein [Quillaja saponaria]|uniref:Surfeit locus protein 2 family protein n=1 Tax=Quillaja saponaria TaxID=32244 RepID=A0AAD7M6Q9_QUISA|nr:Surfeit locus protein 2 family protein [Quillaja saponaria]
MFKQDPLCRSKLKCKLTGDTINKSEEHIWKHINGKRFLNKLDAAEGSKESEELSVRTKRMSIEIGPSSFASRKKKIKLNHPI